MLLRTRDALPEVPCPSRRIDRSSKLDGVRKRVETVAECFIIFMFFFAFDSCQVSVAYFQADSLRWTDDKMNKIQVN